MKKIAIIPARGGSKRIPRKNIKEFLGKPIIAYSIQAALLSNLFDEVMVSTDDPEIANIAKDYGAKVPFTRSAKNSDDYATTSDVITEVIEEYHNQGLLYEFACCIYPTAPLMKAQDLVNGFSKLNNSDYNAVLPVVEYSYPIWRGLKQSNDKLTMVWPEYKKSRSQDLEKVYHDAGQWYWIRLSKYNLGFWTNNMGSIILDEKVVQDIDNSTDWEMAKIKYRLINPK
jgi:pseudaminic acid cytidylyltransferase